MTTRRHFIHGAIAGLATSLAWSSRGLAASQEKLQEKFEVTHTDEEWRKLLSPAQYEILRKDGTERAYTSPLLKEHRRGTFACAGCDLPLYDSATKFDSGTGWPSFWKPLEKAVVEETDNSYGMVRTAVHCRRCGGHLGHVFNDGPEPTGLRYCMNGVAMTFKTAQA
jgi:peptide-methionine (R)-S-oxide reductase